MPNRTPEIFCFQVEELTSDEEFVEAEEEHQPQYDSDGDEIPDVDDINIDNKNNRANCINSNIDKVIELLQVGPFTVSNKKHKTLFNVKVLEVYDEETCMEMMRSYYEVNNSIINKISNFRRYADILEKV